MNVHLCVCSTQQVMVAWKGTFNFRLLESLLLDILFIGTDYFTCGDKFNNKPIQSFIYWVFFEMLQFVNEISLFIISLAARGCLLCDWQICNVTTALCKSFLFLYILLGK